MNSPGSAQHDAILAAIVDSSEDAIVSKTLEGIITSWNKAAERIFGFTYDEIVGKHISVIIPPDRLHEEDMIISSLRAGKRIEHYQTIRQRKNGQLIHISLSVSPLKNAEGQTIGASKIARDITRQKEAEMRLAQYADQLKILVTTNQAITERLDVNTILQTVTDAATSLSGAAFGAFFYNTTDQNGDSYMLYTLCGAPREAFEKLGMPRNTPVFDITFSGKGVLRSDDIRKDERYGKNSPLSGMPPGHLPVVSYLAVPVMSQKGIVIGGIFLGHPSAGVFHEEHEKLVSAIASQAAIALVNARLYEEVKALNERKDDFIGFASHELKTPLATINGYLQLAEEMPDQVNDFIPKIRKQVDRLTGIISDLLDLSKLQAGRLELHSNRSSVTGLIQDSIESVKHIYPQREVTAALPEEEIVAVIDPGKMSQVIMNVLTNAMKYSDPGTPVGIKLIRLGDRVRIAIEDKGPGIPDIYLDRIFEQFYRVPKTVRKSEGLGLGLYICRQIVEGHRGKIWAESEVGKGSTFYIEFPIE